MKLMKETKCSSEPGMYVSNTRDAISLPWEREREVRREERRKEVMHYKHSPPPLHTHTHPPTHPDRQTVSSHSGLIEHNHVNAPLLP